FAAERIRRHLFESTAGEGCRSATLPLPLPSTQSHLARIVVWISPPLYWHYLCYRRAARGPKIAPAAQYRLDETGSFTPWQTNRNRQR
ncbi:hypothetical protein, partial [Serratia nevei]|uniref:hypothetical protein n=1 Tax=Serratia nevei TaxID=2703794 RepID=UPI003F7F296B